MRRLLTALTAALLVVGMLPLAVLAGVPEADAQQVTATEDTDKAIVLSATESSNANVTEFTPGSPSHGSLVANGSIDCGGTDPVTCTQEFTYSPDTDYNGTDSFTFTATSDGSPSVAATVDITVDPVNDDPTFTVGADVTVSEDSGSHSDGSFITDGSPGPSNESDQTLSYTVVATDTGLFGSGPAISASGGLTFTPATDAFGTTSVAVTLHDSLGGTSGSQSFDITIIPVNDPPSFTKGPNVVAPITGGVTRSGWATNIDAGPGESDGLTFVLTPADGTLFTTGPSVDASTGDLTFTPSGTVGSTTVQVRLDDDGTPPESSPNQSFTITILDGPAADPLNVSVVEDSINNPITLTGSDPQDDPLTFAVATQPAHGTLSGTEPDLTYTPAANFVGTDTFTYTATDGTTVSPASSVTITVTSGNNDPVLAKSDFVSLKATTTTVLNPLANDSGGAGETLAGVTITAVSKPSKGTATITNTDTRVTYDPTGCATGADAFTYTISDGSSTSTKSVGVTITRPGSGITSLKPITDAPAVGFILGSTMGTSVPMKVSWCGVTTSTTSVKSYKVVQSTNAGATYPTTVFSATTARSTTRNVSVNKDYKWKATTTDKLNRTGLARSSLVSRLTRYQNDNVAISYTGPWSTSTVASASGGSERYASQGGAAAELTVNDVRAFAIVGPKSSTRGGFKVYVDGHLVKTVSEHATSTVYRRVLAVGTLTSGSHVIRIVVSGTGRIDLDAIVTLKTP